jgi:hypothetical protein
MGFLRVWVGSYVVKNNYDFLKKLNKVEQCTTFEWKKIKFNLELWKKVMMPQLLLFISGQFGQLPKNTKNNLFIFILH